MWARKATATVSLAVATGSNGKASNICKFKDALTPVLEEIAEADGLVLGSPIYFGDVTGQMRTFLERLAFPWLSYNDYSLTAPKKMPVVLQGLRLDGALHLRRTRRP